MTTFKRRQPKTVAEIQRLPQLNGVVGTDQQEAIWRAGVYGDSHLVIDARAGTGKTFSGLHLLHLMKEVGRIPKYVAFCAFTKSVGLELQKKAPPEVRAGTMHSFGFSALKYEYRNERPIKVESNKLDYLLEDLRGEDYPKMEWAAVIKLAGLCKNTMTGSVDGTRSDDWLFAARHGDLADLCDKYLIEFPDQSRKEVFTTVNELLTESLRDEGRIDFDDMIWVPVVKEIRCWKNDFLIVDEVQDLNKTQQALMMKLGRRVMIVGDPNQAIFGFRGADADSFENSIHILQGHGEVSQFPLTKTRRCPKLHVKEVQHLVPDFEAMEDAPEGKILWEEMEDSLERMQPEEMVLCRTNAPLISAAFSLLRCNKRVKVLGRDIGKNLMSFIEKLAKSAHSEVLMDMLGQLKIHHDREVAKIKKKKYGITDKLVALSDKVNCAKTFLEQSKEMKDLKERMASMFSEQGESGLEGAVVLSSIHKAKGLEAETTRILRPDLLPHPAARTLEDVQQENNCTYVCKTRSKDTMIYVAPPARREEW